MPIPIRFSVHTESCMKKDILDNKSIYEIVDSVAFVIMRFTIRPKPKELGVICKRLVAKYPSIKDRSDSTYVSFTYSLYVNKCVCVCACVRVHVCVHASVHMCVCVFVRVSVY